MKFFFYALVLLCGSVSFADASMTQPAMESLMALHGIDQARCSSTSLFNKFNSQSMLTKLYDGRKMGIAYSEAGCSSNPGSAKCMIALENAIGKSFREIANATPGCGVPFDWSYRLAIISCKNSELQNEKNLDRSEKPCVFTVSKCSEASIDLERLKFRCEKTVNKYTEHADRTPVYECPANNKLQDCRPSNPNAITQKGRVFDKEAPFTEGINTK